jgi:hypothetical protein
VCNLNFLLLLYCSLTDIIFESVVLDRRSGVFGDLGYRLQNSRENLQIRGPYFHIDQYWIDSDIVCILD